MEFLIIFIIGFVSSFFGSLTSGALAMIALSLLSLYGLSPLIALGVFRVGTIGFQIGGYYDFFKARKIVWKYVAPFTLIGLVASVIGANLILVIGEQDIGKIIGFAILFFIPLSLYKPNLGTEQIDVSKARERFGYVRYFLEPV